MRLSSIGDPFWDRIEAQRRVRAGMQGQIARLAAFAGHLEMRNALACVPKVFDLQLAQLLAP
jgi:hypothetical protein